MALQTRQRAVAIVEPLIFLLLDFYGQIRLNTSKCLATHKAVVFILTFFDLLLIQRRPQEVLSWSKFTHHSFSRFWLLLGKDAQITCIQRC